MNHISILIVDDDFIKISSIIKIIKEVYNDTLTIKQASCVKEAIDSLQNNQFHLLITDLQMPLKFDDIPNDRGGESLIKSLYRKNNNVNVPMYIVGLTQFIELKKTYNGVWKIWHYDPSLEDWKINLRDLIFHISLVKSRILTNKIETIFVEGPLDKKLLETSLTLFYSNLAEKVYIDTINYGGGASWVERQLFIWAKSLSKQETSFIKAVGLFDDDIAGNKAINNLRSSINSNSAESLTFSIIKSSYKYSTLLKSIKNKGISFATTIEDLISIECWELAIENQWVENRDPKNINIDESKLSINKFSLTKESLISQNFSLSEALMIIYKIKDENKKQFIQMTCELNNKKTLEYIGYLIKDILDKLKLD